MNYQPTEDLFITPDEAKLGFEIKSIPYPAILPFANDEKNNKAVYDRTVVLELDSENRVRRRKLGEGYIFEKWNGYEWQVAASYLTVSELAEDPSIRQFLLKRDNSIETLEETDE